MSRKGLHSLLVIAMVFVLFGSTKTSAVTYQTGVGVGFTFNPTLSINLSSADILIPNLAPGNSSDSNTITVTVNTNTAYGYTLNVTVGEATNYNTRNLKRSDTDAVFSSIDYGSSLASITTDNTWGYSYKPSGQSSTWTTYSGLPLYNDTENVATLISTEDAANSDSIEFKIAAKASTTQPAGDYKNVINFIAVSNLEPDFLYDRVAALSRGTLAANNVLITDTISTPTSTSKVTDTSNSGVYEYDSTVYGVASDAANTHKIYFYRGILETNPGSYGSAGSANAYPNYVKLDNDTCWRIVRTTGSGGVKMIYNGIYNSNSNSCARSQSGAQVINIPFSSQGSSVQSAWYSNMAYIGYTFNDSVTDSTAATTLGTILGNDSNPSLNNTRSNIKTYIEDTWYVDVMNSYTNKLEANAGYCADRSVYSTSRVLQDESVTTSPYTTSATRYYFGARYRVGDGSLIKTPTLTCPRSTVDLYRYVANSAGVGNELKYPTALLTADEATLSGSGYSTIAAYSSKSFLATGKDFWLLSPGSRNYSGGVDTFYLMASGNLLFFGVGSEIGLRPVISLKSGVEVAGGSGTATDPWTIK